MGSVGIRLGNLYVQIAPTVATPNNAFQAKPLFGICYIDLYSNISDFISGSSRRIRPSNLMRFCLYGCVGPSKTKIAAPCQHATTHLIYQARSYPSISPTLASSAYSSVTSHSRPSSGSRLLPTSSSCPPCSTTSGLRASWSACNTASVASSSQ